MSAGGNSLADRANQALAALRRLLESNSKDLMASIPDAVRQLVCLRDDLITRRRSGSASPKEEDWLRRTNAILSCVVGAEFPVKGIHRERVASAHAALEQMVAEL